MNQAWLNYCTNLEQYDETIEETMLDEEWINFFATTVEDGVPPNITDDCYT